MESILLLAELDIQAGALQPAIERLEGLVARQPRAVPAWVLLGSAHVARGDGARGVEAYRKIPALAPQDPRGPHLVGLALRAQGKAAEARRSFEAALALRPGYVEPLGQLAAMALADRQPDAALARVRQQLALEPRSAPIRALLGRVHLARREMDRAEAAFLEALELEPRLIEGYSSPPSTAKRFGQALDLGLEPLPAALDHPHRREVVGAQRRVVEPADRGRRADPGDRVRPRSRRL